MIKADSVVDLLEAKDRRYRYDSYVGADMKKIYNYIDNGLKLLSFAQDECGTVSDVFILFAISMMGVADEPAILAFLQNIKKRHPEFNIANLETVKDLKGRLTALQRFGYIFVVRNTHVHETDGHPEKNEWNFYFITNDANDLVCHKLSRRIPYNRWLMASPFNEIVEWAACSFVGSRLAHHSNYVEYLTGYFQTKMLGKYFLPSEIRFSDGAEDHYVGILGAYLYHNEDRQTERDLKKKKIEKINAIKNYLATRAPRDSVAEMVVVVDTKEDLSAMIEAIEKTGTLIEYLPYIYFTGEGILKNVEYFEDAFFTLDYDSSGNAELISCVPAFLKKVH